MKLILDYLISGLFTLSRYSVTIDYLGRQIWIFIVTVTNRRLYVFSLFCSVVANQILIRYQTNNTWTFENRTTVTLKRISTSIF